MQLLIGKPADAALVQQLTLAALEHSEEVLEVRIIDAAVQGVTSSCMMKELVFFFQCSVVLVLQ